MHSCPYCGQACYCDGDDTDYGEFIPNEHCPHYYCDSEIEYDDDEEE